MMMIRKNMLMKYLFARNPFAMVQENFINFKLLPVPESNIKKIYPSRREVYEREHSRPGMGDQGQGNTGGQFTQSQETLENIPELIKEMVDDYDKVRNFGKWMRKKTDGHLVQINGSVEEKFKGQKELIREYKAKTYSDDEEDANKQEKEAPKQDEKEIQKLEDEKKKIRKQLIESEKEKYKTEQEKEIEEKIRKRKEAEAIESKSRMDESRTVEIIEEEEEDEEESEYEIKNEGEMQTGTDIGGEPPSKSEEITNKEKQELMKNNIENLKMERRNTLFQSFMDTGQIPLIEVEAEANDEFGETPTNGNPSQEEQKAEFNSLPPMPPPPPSQ